MVPGEDTQYFSAIAQRSTLPDYAKDGGIASISPRLANDWVAGNAAQNGLNFANDAERTAALRNTCAEWIVLPSVSATAFQCLYRNAAVKVCRIGMLQLQLAAIDPR